MASGILTAIVCPWCNSGLRYRTRYSDGGTFIGCSAFPKCRFACDVPHVVVAVAPAALDLDRELKALISRWHPDRGATVSTHDVTVALNALREKLRGEVGR